MDVERPRFGRRWWFGVMLLNSSQHNSGWLIWTAVHRILPVLKEDRWKEETAYDSYPWWCHRGYLSLGLKTTCFKQKPGGMAFERHGNTPGREHLMKDITDYWLSLQMQDQRLKTQDISASALQCWPVFFKSVVHKTPTSCKCNTKSGMLLQWSTHNVFPPTASVCFMTWIWKVQTKDKHIFRTKQ